MFLNSIKQQQNGTSQLCEKRVRNSFALQRNQEWGKFPSTGLNIVLVSMLVPDYLAKNDHNSILAHTLFHEQHFPTQK